MSAPISSVGLGAPNLIEAINSRTAAEAPAKAGETDFGDLLGDAITQASAAEKSSEEMGQRFAAGDPNVGIHEVMIEAEKANLAVRYAVTLKNRAVEAYREIMRTPV